MLTFAEILFVCFILFLISSVYWFYKFQEHRELIPITIPILALAITISFQLVTNLNKEDKKEVEKEQKTHTMISLLQDELGLIQDQFPPYNRKLTIYRDPITMEALSPLIDGDLLEYSKNAQLIRELLQLRLALSKYDDFIRMTNFAQSIVPIPDNTHARWYTITKERFQGVIQAKKAILGELETATLH